MAYAWDYGISSVNDNRAILMRSRLIPVQEDSLVPKDSFMASNKVCKMFQYSLSGMVALFGPQTPENAGHVQSVAEMLHIPHIETRYEEEEKAFKNYFRFLFLPLDPIFLSSPPSSHPLLNARANGKNAVIDPNLLKNKSCVISLHARWDYSFERKDFSINIHPHPAVVGKVILQPDIPHEKNAFV